MSHYEVIHLANACAIARIGIYHYTRSNGKCRYTVARGWHIEQWVSVYPLSVEAARELARQLNQAKEKT